MDLSMTLCAISRRIREVQQTNPAGFEEIHSCGLVMDSCRSHNQQR
jgi:hypothetical protein